MCNRRHRVLKSFALIPITGSIHDQPKDTIRERRLYEKLKALNKYHKRTGLESIMYKKFTERRQKVRLNNTNPNFQQSFH